MKRATQILVAIVALAAATVALGGGSRQEASYLLNEERTDRATAETFEFDYRNPEDPEGKPPPVRRVVTKLPHAGGRYDPTAPKSCTATDPELTALGSDACPPKSLIGGGVVTVDTGIPGPGRFITADVEFINNAEDPDGEFIYLNTVRDTEARTVIRADVTRRRTITEITILPGSPPDGSAIDTVDLEVEEVSRRVGGERRRYTTTPSHCPDRGFWRTRVHFSYEDGVTQTEKTATPCRN